MAARPTPRASAGNRHDALRDRLLAAAEAMMDVHGLAGLRARALAEQAGCAVGAIYLVFPDLDALVLAVNARTLAAVDAALAAAGQHPDPAEQMSRLALAYLGYARGHRQRWRALFQHRLPPGRHLPPEYASQLEAAFRPLDRPLSVLMPAFPATDRALLARTLFSAVHGIVDLGLDEKVAELGPGVLAGQLDRAVRALAAGLVLPA